MVAPAAQRERDGANPMSSVPILPIRLHWPSTLGNFLLNFGTLDYFVVVFLKDHLASEKFERIKNLHFKDRIIRNRV